MTFKSELETFSRQMSTATFILANCSVIGQFPLTESINMSPKLSYVLYPSGGGGEEKVNIHDLYPPWVTLTAQISMTLSCHLSLSVIAPGRSSACHPVFCTEMIVFLGFFFSLAYTCVSMCRSKAISMECCVRIEFTNNGLLWLDWFYGMSTLGSIYAKEVVLPLHILRGLWYFYVFNTGLFLIAGFSCVWPFNLLYIVFISFCGLRNLFS